MKRGIQRQVEIQRTVTYSYSRPDLLRLLKLPDDAVIEVDGTVIDAEPGEPAEDAGYSLRVHVKEALTSRAPKVAAATEAA